MAGSDDTPEQAKDDRRPPEFDLWCSALLLLVEDAQAYREGKRKARGAEPIELLEAYRDVMQCGRMLCWLCAHTGHDPQWISEKFRKNDMA